MMKTFTSFLLLLLMSANIFAQQVEMADSFRGEGKIYIVVIVMSIIVAGLFGYLFYLDKKLSEKEKNS